MILRLEPYTSITEGVKEAFEDEEFTNPVVLVEED
jgi:hypothetical protein